MAIKIVEEPDIQLTRDEYERLHQEWEMAMRYTTEQRSFESFVRHRKICEQRSAQRSES